jgi:hypothetical protein
MAGYQSTDEMPHDLLVDAGDGTSLYGSCSYCHRRVDNHDENHRVSAIMDGGRGVECVLRGDIEPLLARPLGRRS